jgi:phage portal protein BeeE
MKVLDRLRPTKSFSEPNFWSLDRSSLFTTMGREEDIPVDFERYVHDAFRSNGIVYACIAARSMVFSQARFLWQQFENGRPGDLFHDSQLGILERPWTNAATGDLLARMEQDVSIAGNFYATRIVDEYGVRLRRMRPDWVTIVVGSKSGHHDALDSRILSYAYKPPGQELVILDPAEVVHYTEQPDPLAQFRGMSWLTPVIREVQADKAATVHKLNFFRNGATPSMAITYDQTLAPDAFDAFVTKFREAHEGVDNAYKTLHLGGGADVTAVGADFKQLDFKSTIGTGETRIAAASGAHPVIVPLAEGMQGSSLNAGNFSAARRLFVDGRIRALWSKAAPALESILTPPPGAHLSYDARDIPFLRQDAKEEAEIRGTDATTIASLVTAGYTSESAVEAVASGDFRLLEHTGLFSVQLQPAGVSVEGSET